MNPDIRPLIESLDKLLTLAESGTITANNTSDLGEWQNVINTTLWETVRHVGLLTDAVLRLIEPELRDAEGGGTSL